MKCAVHTEVDATGYCRNCGKALCAECERNVRGMLYCEDCLAAKMTNPIAAPGVYPTTAASSATHPGKPGVALVLGFIPGLGAVYNGEYMKALVHVLIFGSLIAAQDSHMGGGLHAVLGLAIACFYFYMPIDAFRVAKAREAGVAGAPVEEFFPFACSRGRKPTGAFILIGLGFFLLLANLGLFDWDWFGKLWPIGLIALGVYILANRMQRQSGS